MLHTTFLAINAVLRIDPTISPLERCRIMRRLEEKDVPVTVGPPTKPRLLRRHEVAERLGCSLRTVDKLAAQGVLERVCLPGRVRASGFREGDLSVLLTREAVSRSLSRANARAAGASES